MQSQQHCGNEWGGSGILCDYSRYVTTSILVSACTAVDQKATRVLCVLNTCTCMYVCKYATIVGDSYVHAYIHADQQISISLSPATSLFLSLHTHNIYTVPAEPVTNLMVTGFTETTVSLSWMTGFDGFTPITGIEILVTPERGAPPSTNPIILPPSNQTIISNLLPFREHEFSMAVLNLVGTSERRNITASTLSLRKLNIDMTVFSPAFSLSLSPSLSIWALGIYL